MTAVTHITHASWKVRFRKGKNRKIGERSTAYPKQEKIMSLRIPSP